MNPAIMLICLAGTTTLAQPESVFKAPRIEVRTESRDGRTYSALFYNRVYMARQYHKSKDEPELHRLPTTYFHDKSPIGVIMKDPKWFPDKDAPPVAVLGMDAGTMAAYAKKGQTFHFTERVPTFVKLSFPDKGEKRYFSFLKDAMDRGANVKVFEGEPREMIEKHGKDKFYKVIVVENYKLPVIDVHKELMTKEGLQMLMSKVRQDGIVAFHTSNRYYILPPIIASAAKELNFACIVGNELGFYGNDAPKQDFRFSSEWVIVARDVKHLAHLKKNKSNQIDWHPAVLAVVKSGKLVEYKFDKEFLWTDKGEQSFRGLYRSDPGMQKLHDAVNDLRDYLPRAGVSQGTASRITISMRQVIGAWSDWSVDNLNRSILEQLENPAEFKAPLIEVKNDTRDGKPYSFLMHNGIYLGRQYQKTKEDPKLNQLPTTYYHDQSPIGIILKDANWFPDKGAPPVAVLGMDIGTQAAYAKKGQTFHFTERVPTLVKLSFPAKGKTRYFTFLQDAIDRGADIKVFEGEPREMLEKHGKNGFYKVIVVQTFKTPVHELHKELLTKEGLQMLMSKVRDDGIVAFHTSNRYYQLNPIIASAANELKLASIAANDSPDSRDPNNSHRYSSEWIMVARDAKHLAHLKKDDSNRIDWHPPRYEIVIRGRLVTGEVGKKFLWTDKGEQSLRGLFRSDPQIDKLHQPFYKLEEILVTDLGFNKAYQWGQPIHGVIREWSAASAERMNRELPAKKSEKK